jgi:hypothetical protein
LESVRVVWALVQKVLLGSRQRHLKVSWVTHGSTDTEVPLVAVGAANDDRKITSACLTMLGANQPLELSQVDPTMFELH